MDNPRDLPEAEIFDLDGTLADVTPVRHFVDGTLGRHRDFDAFHRYACTEALPIKATVQKVREAEWAGRAVILVSGRQEKWRSLTLSWLTWHDIPWNRLWMRLDGDFRPDTVVKAGIYRTFIKPHFNVVKAHDDRPSICELWRSLGIEVDVVPGWTEAPERTRS